MNKNTGDLKAKYFILVIIAIIFVGIILVFVKGLGRGFENSGETVIVASFSPYSDYFEEADMEEIYKYASSLFPVKVEVSEGTFGDFNRHLIIKSFDNPGLTSQEFLQKMNLVFPNLLLESSDFLYRISPPSKENTLIGLLLPAVTAAIIVFLFSALITGIKLSLKVLVSVIISIAAIFSFFIIIGVQNLSVIITGLLVTFLLGFLFSITSVLEIRKGIKGVKNIKIDDKLEELKKTQAKKYIFIISFSLVISIISMLLGLILGYNNEWLQLSTVALMSTAFTASTSYFFSNILKNK